MDLRAYRPAGGPILVRLLEMPPPPKMTNNWTIRRGVHLSICLPVCMFACLSVCLPVCMSIYLSFCLYACSCACPFSMCVCPDLPHMYFQLFLFPPLSHLTPPPPPPPPHPHTHTHLLQHSHITPADPLPLSCRGGSSPTASQG